MAVERLNELIDEALKEAEIRPHSESRTNVLNAEYALGKIFAIRNIIREEYGIDAFIESRDRTSNTEEELFSRVEELYTK